MMLHEMSLVFIYFAPFVHFFFWLFVFLFGTIRARVQAQLYLTNHIFFISATSTYLHHLYYYHHLDPNPFLSALALGSDVYGHSCILLLFILGDMLKCC